MIEQLLGACGHDDLADVLDVQDLLLGMLDGGGEALRFSDSHALVTVSRLQLRVTKR